MDPEMDLIEIPGLKALLQDLNPTVPTKKGQGSHNGIP